MKRFTLTLLLFSVLCPVVAQEQGDNRIAIDDNNTIIVKDGKLSLELNGLKFDFKGDDNDNQGLTIIENTNYTSKSAVHYSFMGLGAPSYNHLALIELGSNFLANTDYSDYSVEEADHLAFSNHKSVYFAINLATINVGLNRSRTLGFTMGIGFACDNYTFAGKYTMELRDGMMRPVALDEGIKKSKLAASYLHIPFIFDWNIKRGFFLGVGANVDILINSALSYKKPKTAIKGVAQLNPVQVGITGRIGWKRIYFFANYSFMQMFKNGVGPKGNRMSMGAGLYF